MIQILRRAGIAIGSIVAAWLVMSLVGWALLPFVGVSFRPTDPGATGSGSAIVGLVTLLLGGLIYRDIIRREQRTS